MTDIVQNEEILFNWYNADSKELEQLETLEIEKVEKISNSMEKGVDEGEISRYVKTNGESLEVVGWWIMKRKLGMTC